jgi:hypothetical protein
MKLFTIGDSVSQGFMSGAAARSDLSFSTFLARAMGLQDHRFPRWQAGGHPTNLENVMRRLFRRYGANIRGLEWITVLHTINDVLDEAEDYYERGAGAENVPYPGGLESFHNVSVRGFDVADSWLVTPRLCREEIQIANRRNGGDGYLKGPNASFYRTALAVLNPSRDPRFDDHSQLKWLEHHATGEGVENVVLWLGANNALGTVIGLDINRTPGDPTRRPVALDHRARVERGWNLWHPDDFAAEYRELLDRVNGIMQRNARPDWRVFVGTVPAVTIAPLAKGIGAQMKVNGSTYFKYYTYFPFEEAFARETGIHLTFDDAVYIDDCISRYNATINNLVAEKNAGSNVPHYFVVDVAVQLSRLAWKRNNGRPTYQFPPEFDALYPPVNTKYYHADSRGRLKQGGIFGIDGIHPTAIGQGLIAHEFMLSMRAAGVPEFQNGAKLNWDTIFASDSLYQDPIPLMGEIYEHETLARHLLRLIRLFNEKRRLTGSMLVAGGEI